MMTQSRLDCKAELVEKHGLNGDTSEFVHMWDLHYAHEDGRPFEDELKTRIKEIFPDANQQELYDLILTYFEDAKRRRRFFQRGGLEGYGYEVVERDNGSFRLKLRTYDKEVAKAYWEALRLDPDAVAPDTSKEVPPSKMLVIHDHHGTLYFKADTPEMLIEKSVEFIMAQANALHYYKPEKKSIESVLGMTEEKVNAMPDGTGKEVVQQELKRLKEREEQNSNHITAWNALCQIKKSGKNSKFRDIAEVLNFYHGDRWEGKWSIVELQ